MLDSAVVFKFDPPVRFTSVAESEWYGRAVEKLVGVIQELSHARTLEDIIAIVREAARALTGADGATFVLREGEQCYYADENAISPLWKGSRFPMSACISGWAMMNKSAAAIPDIYQDDRIPIDAYRPTFVKSLAMVPIRRENPIGAIGNYWAKEHQASDAELHVLQALADTASVAMENVQLYAELQSKVKALEESNYELGRFAWVASHDLQEPLRTITTQVEMLEHHCGDKIDEQGRHYIERASQGAQRLQTLITNLLLHAQAEKTENFKPTPLDQAVNNAIQNLHTLIEETHAEIHCDNLPWVWGNPNLLMALFQNLFANAMKFRKPDQTPKISVNYRQHNGRWVLNVSDNGIGIGASYHEAVFGLFYRLHSQDAYPGSGLGLATCRKIVQMHNGKIWLESNPGEGTQVFIQLPAFRNEENQS